MYVSFEIGQYVNLVNLIHAPVLLKLIGPMMMRKLNSNTVVSSAVAAIAFAVKHKLTNVVCALRTLAAHRNDRVMIFV